MRTIFGVLFSLAIIPFALLVYFGFIKSVSWVYSRLSNEAAVVFSVLFLFLLVLVTALSKLYAGGGSMSKIFKKEK